MPRAQSPSPEMKIFPALVKISSETEIELFPIKNFCSVIVTVSHLSSVKFRNQMESIFSEDNVTALVKATYKKHKTDKIKKYFT